MSLQALYTTPVHSELERLWNASASALSDMKVRIGEIQSFLDEQSISCVWLCWPHWVPQADPVVYIPTRIKDVHYTNKKDDGRQVLSLNLEHEFPPAINKGKQPYVMKVELEHCHFIKGHSWTSDALSQYRLFAKKDLPQRYRKLFPIYKRPSETMQAIALEIYNAQSITNGVTPASSTSSVITASSLANSLGHRTSTSIQLVSAQPPFGTNCTPSGSMPLGNSLKRPHDNVDRISPAKRLSMSVQSSSTPPPRQDEEQAVPEQLTVQVQQPMLSEQERKLAKAHSGLANAASLIAAYETQTEALEKQAKIEVGDSSLLYLQTKGLLLQLQRIKADLTQLVEELA